MNLEFTKQSDNPESTSTSTSTGNRKEQTRKLSVVNVSRDNLSSHSKSECNDRVVETTTLSHPMLWENKENSMESLGGLYYLLIHISYLSMYMLSNYQSFQNIPSCDLSSDQVMWYPYLILSLFSIFRNPRLVHPRITLILSIYLVVLFLVQAGNLWHRVDKENSLEFPLIGSATYTRICVYKYLPNYFIPHISFWVMVSHTYLILYNY